MCQFFKDWIELLVAGLVDEKGFYEVDLLTHLIDLFFGDLVDGIIFGLVHLKIKLHGVPPILAPFG